MEIQKLKTCSDGLSINFLVILNLQRADTKIHNGPIFLRFQREDIILAVEAIIILLEEYFKNQELQPLPLMLTQFQIQ